MHFFATTTSEQVLQMGKRSAFVEVDPRAENQTASQLATKDV
jgi:hypothetical protein